MLDHEKRVRDEFTRQAETFFGVAGDHRRGVDRALPLWRWVSRARIGARRRLRSGISVLRLQNPPAK